jgi:hypothetical protein
MEVKAMDTMETDHLVDDYLRRLEHAASHMQRARRTELVAEIRGHIETALSQEQAANEAAVRNVLDRLGSPEDIVEAAEPPPPPGDRRAGVLEIIALLALIVPVIGWMIGTILAFVSRAWSRRDKLIGALLLLVPLLVLSVAFVAAAGGGEDAVPPGEIGPVSEKVEDPSLGPGPAELYLFVAGVPSAMYLGWRLRRDPDTSPTHPE